MLKKQSCLLGLKWWDPPGAKWSHLAAIVDIWCIVLTWGETEGELSSCASHNSAGNFTAVWDIHTVNDHSCGACK